LREERERGRSERRGRRVQTHTLSICPFLWSGEMENHGGRDATPSCSVRGSRSGTIQGPSGTALGKQGPQWGGTGAGTVTPRQAREVGKWAGFSV
jgi:hypothetical protein